MFYVEVDAVLGIKLRFFILSLFCLSKFLYKNYRPDITDQILKKNNLDLIIRSHECKQSGYEYVHENKVLTIFSGKLTQIK